MRIPLFGDTAATVVGVAEDVAMYLGQPPSAPVYYPLLARPLSRLVVAVRTSAPSAETKASLREAVHRVDQTVPVDRLATMEELVSDQLARRRFYGTLLAAFAGCSLVLAAAGIFGAVNYAVVQRTREVGIRRALGATTQHVVLQVLRPGMRAVIVGSLIGLIGSVGTNQLLRTFLYEVEPTDSLVLGSATLVLLVVSALAGYLPARRAAYVDPMVALRTE